MFDDWQTILLLQKNISYTATVLLAVAAYSDIKTFRIPNRLVFGIATLGVLRLILLHDLFATIYAVAMVVLIFIAGLVLFSRRLIGGGDVKLLIATILLIRYPDFYEFFILMGVFGALLSITLLLLRQYSIFLGARIAAVVSTGRLSVPFGVAIGAAGIATLLLQPMLFRYSFPLAPSFLW